MQLLTDLGLRLSNLKYSKFLILVLLILLIRNGISPIGEEYVGWLRLAAINYPDPVVYLISSPIPLMLMKLLDYPSTLIWWGVGVCVFVFWIYVSLRYISIYFKNNQKIVTVLFLASTPVAVAMSMIGHIDVYTLFGATIAIFGRFKGHLLLGAIFAAGGNSDQAIAATVCLVFLTLGGSKLAKRVLFRWALVSSLAYIALHFLVNIPAKDDPKQVMLAELHIVVVNSVSVWHFLIYAFLGILWIPWFLLVFRKIVTFREKIFTLIGVIVMPFSMSFLILDGTRVGATVGYVTLLISFKDKLSDKLISQENSNKILGAITVYLILIPNILVDSSGYLRIPISKFLEHYFP
jgi:hypothetical protein